MDDKAMTKNSWAPPKLSVLDMKLTAQESSNKGGMAPEGRTAPNAPELS